MGKIFDALQKSQKRPASDAVPTGRQPVERRVVTPKAPKAPKASEGITATRPAAIPPARHDAPHQVKEPTPASHSKAGATQIPAYPELQWSDKLVMLSNPQSFEAEQFRMLRTSLLFPGAENTARSIMITSAVPGEGKSFVAANLAISIAQGINEHVLLMECDIRRPSIHTYFGYGNAEGLSEYLAQGTPLADSLLKTGINKLTILPGGKPPHNPAELLSSQKMGSLLEEVKSRYSDRYIIIDSPPPRLTAETNAIAKRVDGIIVVVKLGSTRREMVDDLVRTVGRDKIIGVVTNHHEISTLGYSGYGKYGKHGGYYHR